MALAERLVMGVVGILVFTAYTAAGALALFVLAVLYMNPPALLPTVLAFCLGVVLASYLGYRMGMVQLVASLEAKELHRRNAPELYRRLERLSLSMAVETPPVLVADLGTSNALSIGGPRSGVIVVDRTLLRVLTIDELEGILAHELAHMERWDTFLNTAVMTIVRTLAAVVFLVLSPIILLLAAVDRGTAWWMGIPQWNPGLGRAFRLAVLAVLGLVFGVAILAYLAYSRHREYAADTRAVEVTGKPIALARALQKLHRVNDPASGLLSILYTHEDPNDRRSVFSTHPPVDLRIDRLLARARHSDRRPAPEQIDIT